MQAGGPDRDPAPDASATLAARVGALLRAPGWPDRELAVAVAIFIALGPLLTIAGAQLLAGRDRVAAQRLHDDLEPRLAAERAAREARSEIASIVGRPAIGTTLEALARGLPADAMVVRAERTAKGALEIEISTPDPDKLRSAIRRDPALARLRDLNQRQSDTAMIVTLREEGR